MARKNFDIKVYHVATVMALSLALVVWYFLMTQVMYRHNYNYDIADKENVYRVEARMKPQREEVRKATEVFGKMSAPLAQCLRRLPCVEALVGVNESHIGLANDGYTEIYSSRTSIQGYVYNAIPPDMEMLGLTMVCGSLTFMDEGMGGVIIPESYALKLFGRADRINGMKIAWQIAGSDKVQVVGVYKDLDENSVIPNGVYHTSAHLFDYSWGMKEFNVFVRTSLPASIGIEGTERTNDSVITSMIASTIKTELLKTFADDSSFIANYKDIEFRVTRVANDDRALETTNYHIYFVYQLAAILILIIALVVSFNISMSEAPLQMKTISTMMVLGVSKREVRLRILFKSIVRALVAMLIALLFVVAFSHRHWANEMFMAPTAVYIPYNLPLLPWMACIALAIGMLSGIYPALYVTRHPLTMAIRGRFALSRSGRAMRNVMLAMQFILSFATTMYFAVVLLQNRHLHNYDYGFDKDNLLYAKEIVHPDFEHVLWNMAGIGPIMIDSIEQQIRADKDVDGMCRTDLVPLVHCTRDRVYHMDSHSGEIQMIEYLYGIVDKDFFSTLRIGVNPNVIAIPDGGSVYVISPEMRKMLQNEDATPVVTEDNYITFREGRLNVGGVVNRLTSVFPDARVRHLDKLLFVVHAKDHYSPYIMVHLRPGADKRAVAQRLYNIRKRCLKKYEKDYTDKTYTDEMYRFSSYEQEFNNTYKVQMQFELPMFFLSLCCIAITLMGLVGVTMIERRYMQRNTAIRRVLGTTTMELMLMQMRKYGWMLTGCAMVGMPAGYWLSKHWIATFVLQTDVPLWLPLLVFVLISVLVLMLVVVQNVINVNKDLTLAIKTE